MPDLATYVLSYGDNIVIFRDESGNATERKGR